MTSNTNGDVRTWWFLISDSKDYPMKVTIEAQDFYTAKEMSRAMYGSRILSEPALL